MLIVEDDIFHNLQNYFVTTNQILGHWIFRRAEDVDTTGANDDAK